VYRVVDKYYVMGVVPVIRMYYIIFLIIRERNKKPSKQLTELQGYNYEIIKIIFYR